MTIESVWPKDWQSKPEYVKLRIVRLKRALWFCRGRAADLHNHVAQEIKRLEQKVQS